VRGGLGPTSRFRLGLAAIAAAAAALRLYGIGRQSLWFDEALEYGRAASTLTTALRGRAIDQDPPALALFYHGWLGLGDSEAWLRLPSAVLGVVAVVLVVLWSRRVIGPRGALVAGVLAALSPVLVHYSQEMNQYSAMVFVALLLIIAFEKLLRSGGDSDWILFTALSVFALALHFGLGFLLAAAWLYMLRRVWRSGPGHDALAGGAPSAEAMARQRQWLLRYTVTISLSLAALWLLGLGEGMAVPHLDRRLGGTHLEKEFDYITDVGWREILVFDLLPFSGGPMLNGVRVLSLMAAAGAISLWRSGAAGRRAVGLYFFLPLALTYAASLMGWYPLGFRYGLFTVPALFVGLAAGVESLWRRRGAAGSAALVASAALLLAGSTHFDVSNDWLWVPREELRPVLEHLAGAAAATDVVYVYYGAVPAYGYYGRDLNARTVVGRHPGDADAEDEAARVAHELRQAAASGSGAHPRLWVVLSHVDGDEGEELLAAFRAILLAGRAPVDAGAFAADNASAHLLAWP